jgi:hypothetical protein
MSGPGHALRAAGIRPWTPRELLAARFPEHLNLIAPGQHVDEVLAKRLHQATGISKGFWLNAEHAYQDPTP